MDSKPGNRTPAPKTEGKIMPDFGNAFSGLACDRKLTDAELIRAMRFAISAEYEAIQLYMQLAESTDNILAKQVLMDISNEERVHAGEFQRVLKELAPDEEAFYRQGAAEVEDEFIRRDTPPEEPAPVKPAESGGLRLGSLKSILK
jgi:hypothetical protein